MAANGQANAEVQHLDGECASLEDQLQGKASELDQLRIINEAEIHELKKTVRMLEQVLLQCMI